MWNGKRKGKEEKKKEEYRKLRRNREKSRLNGMLWVPAVIRILLQFERKFGLPQNAYCWRRKELQILQRALAHHLHECPIHALLNLLGQPPIKLVSLVCRHWPFSLASGSVFLPSSNALSRNTWARKTRYMCTALCVLFIPSVFLCLYGHVCVGCIRGVVTSINQSLPRYHWWKAMNQKLSLLCKVISIGWSHVRV